MAGEANARIAVCDRASSYRRGVGAALAGAGYVIEEIEDLGTQRLLSGVEVVLFTVRSASDWQVLGELRSLNPELKIIALLVDATPDRHAEALRCGADGAVRWESSPEGILAVVAATLEGQTLLPTPVAQSIAVS